MIIVSQEYLFNVYFMLVLSQEIVFQTVSKTCIDFPLFIFE